MFSKLTTTLVPSTTRSPVYWIELIPAKKHSNRECPQDDGACLMRVLRNSTPYDDTVCSQLPDNVHENIKQKELIPLTILIILTNFLVLLFIIANKRFHTPTYIFVASLGVADLFVGFVSIVTIATKANEKSQDMCLARIGFTVAAISASVWSLTCVALDRYIAVTRALLYKSIMTKKKTVIGITCSWVFSMVVGFLPMAGWKNDSYKFYCSFMYVLPEYYIVFLFSVSAVIPFTTMFIIYGILFKSARFHIKQIEIIEKLQSDKRNSGMFGISSRNLRSIKTFAAILGCVVITWLPFLIATTVQIIQTTRNCTLHEVIGTHLLVLGFSNSFLNPLIYALGTKDFREKVGQVFRRRCNVLNSSQVFPNDDAGPQSVTRF
ncbi:glucose-dependent insulinotropic receptor-like [Mercenaria mercenaria]|uniref:glucose-dependent insulinotropic receptor-like n=1 Tax=Mercenaria mercenaria TaxID=6596 RepID=UPI00234F8617|nr:glucose-dependent insulinotropic receptor-like [Mercenaria mercenaria]